MPKPLTVRQPLVTGQRPFRRVKGTVQFAPPLFAALYLRRATGAGVLAGMICGISVNLFFLYGPDYRPWELHAGLYGLVANIAALALVTLLRPGEPDAGE